MSGWGFACIELAGKVKYEGPPGQLNDVLSWLYARHQKNSSI